MTEPLVDSEGYPLSNIDVYQVRHARHQIKCKYSNIDGSLYYKLISDFCLEDNDAGV